MPRVIPNMRSPRLRVADEAYLDLRDGFISAMLRSGETVTLDLETFTVVLPPECREHETWFAVRAEGIIRYHGGRDRWTKLLVASDSIDELAEHVNRVANEQLLP